MEKATLLAKTGHFDEAADAARRAVSLEPWYFGAGLNLGYYHFRMGQMEEAKKRIGTLLALYDNWPAASSNDSGYRKTILFKDSNALARAVAVLQ